MRAKSEEVTVMRQNPSLLLLAFCPALAVASTAWAGLALGLLSAAVVLLTLLVRKPLERLLPPGSGFLSGLVLAAALATLTCLLTEAFLPGVYAVTGSLLPLLAVQAVLVTLVFRQDGPSAGLWLGYVLVLFAVGMIREFLGAGSLFGFQLLDGRFTPISAVSGAPGGFLVLALAGMVMNALGAERKEGNP